jgi:5-methylcytosine-specific restriction endonuclease McrA
MKLMGKRSPEVTAKIEATKKARYPDGFKFSEETRQKISLANKGKKLSESHKAKIAASSKGRLHTEETKEFLRNHFLGRKITWGDKISKTLSGRTYVGMYGKEKGEARAKRHSEIMKAKCANRPKTVQPDRYHTIPGYEQWRADVLRRDNYLCQICGSNNNLHAHHRKSWIEFPELRLELSNGRTLCSECHKLFHKALPRGNAQVSTAHIFAGFTLIYKALPEIFQQQEQH